VDRYVATYVVCALVIAFLWHQSWKRFAGMHWWVMGFCLQATASILIILRGGTADWLSMMMANPLVIVGTLADLLGLERFVGRKRSLVHNYILLAAFTGVNTYFAFIHPNLAARNLNLSLGFLTLCS
jgi:hypothetical protein